MALEWMLGQFGVDIRRMLLAARGIGPYLRNYRAFRRAGQRPHLLPCLRDRYAAAGSAGEYLYQDLVVAREILRSAPRRHLDVGSRVDGFVTHLAVFRTVEVMDVRPMRLSDPAIAFVEKNVLDVVDDPAWRSITDSVSCLHALEHFGLGRYGDPVDAAGHWRGLRALAWMLEPGGMLYLGVPVGTNAVFFDAHRVLDVTEVTERLDSLGLRLKHFIYVDPARGAFSEPVPPPSRGGYGVGIFIARMESKKPQGADWHTTAAV